jgi:YggT family protein
MNPSQQALLFLINLVFDAYLLILMLRFILCWLRVDYFNPITQLIIQFTQFLVAPIRRFLPTKKGIEISTLMLMVVLDIIKFFFVGLIIMGLPKNIFGLFLLAAGDLLRLFLNVFFYAILVQAILSFFPLSTTPLTQLLHKLTSPLLRPVRHYLPPIKGFDFSPLPVLIILQLLIILFVSPLSAVGAEITFGGMTP